MATINNIFHMISAMLGLLAITILVVVNQDQKHSNRLLALVLGLFVAQHILLLFLFSGIMLKLPWLLRVFGPTTFLIAPAAFLYIRSVVQMDRGFRKYDWLFLIPALLAVVNFLPVYLLPRAEKLRLLEESFYLNNQHPDMGSGILPRTTYYLLRSAWSAFCLFLGFRCLYQHYRRQEPSDLQRNRALFSWLWIFNILMTVIFLATLVKVVTTPLFNSRLTIPDILLGIFSLITCLLLFLRPKILYGLHQPISPTIDERVSEKSSLSPVPPLSTGADEPMKETAGNVVQEGLPSVHWEDHRYKKLIETHCILKQRYLDPNYSLTQMVDETGIPRHSLSAFINKEYGMGFREWLNRQRIIHFQENCHQSSWAQFTLEAMATECGFSNRSTFIKNFKSFTGITPSHFLKQAPSTA
jgi:AraC-like DNA-binding protein